MPKTRRQLAAWTVALAALLPAAGVAQLRTIPHNAVVGTIRHVQGMWVDIGTELGTRRMLLAPGAQIRDTSNRVVLPVAVPPGALVRYTLDRDGMIRGVWILSAREALGIVPPHPTFQQ